MQRALILGAAKSGKSACKMLGKKGYMVYLTDDNQKKLNRVYRDRFMKSLSLIVLSPGIPISHPIVEIAKQYGIDLLCEFELGVLEMKCPSIMITGTNGKTTTTLLTHKLLQGFKNGEVFLGGNVGIPVTSFASETKAGDIAVLEASSFQLEYKKRAAAHVAVLLNLAPDHLSRHGSMENYIQSKLKIFDGQTSDDFAVLNYDDKLAVEKALPVIDANVYYFSTKSVVKGCFALDGSIYFNDGNTSVKIADVSDVKIMGEHNLQNALAAILSSLLVGGEPGKIRKNLSEFSGVSHRLEWVMDVENVGFFNDSKATNIASTIVAMNAMTADTTIILGGSDKGLDFDELFLNVPEKIVNFICIGETKQKLLASAKKCGCKNVYEADTLREAVDLGFSLSKNGDAVLLSPACASYDMFSSYEERGKVFINIVREKLKDEEKHKLKHKFRRKKQKDIS